MSKRKQVRVPGLSATETSHCEDGTQRSSPVTIPSADEDLSSAPEAPKRVYARARKPTRGSKKSGDTSGNPTADPANPPATGTKSKKKTVEYLVEKVLNKRFSNGTLEYLLKWKGYSIGECSWEPMEFISAAKLVNEFETCNKNRLDLPNYVISNERDILKVLGITRVTGRLEFVVKYRDGTILLVPARFANCRYPLRVIEFYERNFKIIPNIAALREAAKRRINLEKKKA